MNDPIKAAYMLFTSEKFEKIIQDLEELVAQLEYIQIANNISPKKQRKVIYSNATNNQ